MIESFITSAIIALQEMVQIEAYQVEALPADFAGRGLTARIRLMHDHPGVFSMTVTDLTARQFAVRYLPTDTELTDDLVADVVGEMANVIAGQAKTLLKATPYHYALTTPEVIRSDDVRSLVNTTDNAAKKVVLLSEAGCLHIEVLIPGKLP